MLPWEPALRPGRYTVAAKLTYDLNRYNDRAYRGDQRELGSYQLDLSVR